MGTGRGGAGGASGGGDDGAEEQRRRDTVEGFVAAQVARLADLPGLWAEVVGDEGRVRGSRHLEALAVRLAELLETTSVAVMVHPAARPLAPLLAACPRIVGEWELDTEQLTLELMSATVALPPLGWSPASGRDDVAAADAGLDRRRVLLAVIELGVPPFVLRPSARLLVRTLRAADGDRQAHALDLDVPVLAEAVRDRLVDALATAVVLTRTVDGDADGAVGMGPHGTAADDDADTAWVADRVVGLLRALEEALARRAVAPRDPGGGTSDDGEVLIRRATAMFAAERIRVAVRQTLPAGTLEPTRLEADVWTGADPDGRWRHAQWYRLQLDLLGAARGSGTIEVSGPRGRSVRSVVLPHVTELWTDHVESALRRAHAVVPAVRRRPVDELEDPVMDVGPPVIDEADLAEQADGDVARQLRLTVPVPEDIPF